MNGVVVVFALAIVTGIMQILLPVFGVYIPGYTHPGFDPDLFFRLSQLGGS